MSYLTINRLNKSFGSTRAINDISFSASQGEMLCLLGPSGCGKTTLLRMIAGFEQADSGEICIEGKDISRLPAHKRGFGMVFQSLALFPHMSVAENIAYSLKLRGASKAERQARVKSLLETIELPHIADRPVSALSGGQRQRVAIARALALQPKLFLLDEPLSALDAQIRENMQIELRQLQQQFGITTLIVTHDQHEAMMLGDRLVVMKHGEIQQFDTPERLYNAPANPFVAGFIGAANLLNAQAENGRLTLEGQSIPTAQPLPAAGRLTLAVRPENIRLNTQPQAGSLPAVITLARTLGAFTEVMAKTAGGALLKCRGDSELYQQAQAGMPVHLSLDPDKIHLYPAGENDEKTAI